MEKEQKDQLDALLAYAAEELDLTRTQRESATEKYQAVGDWLSKSDSSLAAWDPRIYPQGSFAIGTVTKPVGRDEFDLDLVCELHLKADQTTPRIVKTAVGNRLKENTAYRARLEEKNRCWRIVYANEFHMDILPACQDPTPLRPTRLGIPDKELATWKSTDPKGYATWFMQQTSAVDRQGSRFRGEVEAPPPSSDRTTRTALHLTVRLLKRHRDLYCDGDEDAPISIIITTLAARAYAESGFNRDSILETLHHLLKRMPELITCDGSGSPAVLNPVNPGENFADKWKESPRKAVIFHRWIQAARLHLEQLSKAKLPGMVPMLKPWVGEHLATSAVKRYGEAMHASRPGFMVAAGALSSSSAQARPIPQHTFYGKRERK